MFTFFGSNVDCLTCMLYVLDFFFFLNKTELKFPASTEGDLKSWVGGWFVALEPFAAGCKPQNEACNLVTPLQKKPKKLAVMSAGVSSGSQLCCCLTKPRMIR